MTEYMTCADTAKLVRSALKTDYPGVKFSVRSDVYAGGASIRVAWTDGPTQDTVQAALRLWEGSTFDGMIDLKSSHSSLLAGPDGVREVHFGADYVFANRDMSPEFIARCVDMLPEEPNGRDSHGGQCDGCGSWPKTEDRWYVSVSDHGGRMCCSRECAGRRLARSVDAELVTR